MTNLAASQTKCNLKHFIVRAKDNSLFLASISRLVFLLSKRFFPFIEYNLAFVTVKMQTHEANYFLYLSTCCFGYLTAEKLYARL